MAVSDGVAQGVVIVRGHGGSRHVSIRAIRLGFCIVALASCLAIARLVSVDSVAQRSILSPASEAARWLMDKDIAEHVCKHKARYAQSDKVCGCTFAVAQRPAAE